MRKIKLLLMLLVVTSLIIACQPTTSLGLDFRLNPGVDTIEINSVYEDPGAIASANGQTLEVEVISNTVDATQLGDYQIVYQVTYQEQIITLTRHVHVIDETPPVGTLNPGLDNIMVGDAWMDASVDASDNSLGIVTVTKEGSVNTDVPGEYLITYLLEDESGNQSILYRYVFVHE